MLYCDIITNIIEHLDNLPTTNNLLLTCQEYYPIYNCVPPHIVHKYEIARFDYDLTRLLYQNETVGRNLNSESYLTALIHYIKIENSGMVYVLRFETAHPRIDDLAIAKDLLYSRKNRDILFEFYSGLVHKKDLELKCLSPCIYSISPNLH